jgi:hypothetical protein
MDKTTQFRGLNLCEYRKGEKHFVIIFYLKGQRHKPRRFPVGRFDNNLNVITGETKFGVKQCQERLFKIAKEHQDEYGLWVKDPNLTIAFTSVNQSITIRDLIKFNNNEVGRILIHDPFPFAIIKVADSNINDFLYQDLICGSAKVEIAKPEWINF